MKRKVRKAAGLIGRNNDKDHKMEVLINAKI